MCTTAEALVKTEATSFVCALSVAHGKPPRDRNCAPDAAASTASRPNVRDDGQRPS
jgi:hypothetical protein